MHNGQVNLSTIPLWYTGFSYNATPGSRAEILPSTDPNKLKPGSIVCFDPEAYADDKAYQDTGAGTSALPPGTNYGRMVLKYAPGGGEALHRYVTHCTQPATAILNLPAGVVLSLDPKRRLEKYGSVAAGQGPQDVVVACSGDAVWVRASWSSTALAVGDLIVPANGTFIGARVAVGSVAVADLMKAVGRVILADASTTESDKLVLCQLFHQNLASVATDN